MKRYTLAVVMTARDTPRLFRCLVFLERSSVTLFTYRRISFDLFVTLSLYYCFVVAFPYNVVLTHFCCFLDNCLSWTERDLSSSRTHKHSIPWLLDDLATFVSVFTEQTVSILLQKVKLGLVGRIRGNTDQRLLLTLF